MEQKHRFDETCRYEEGFTIPNWNRLLDGKVVIVVGASYGMGKKMAQVMVEHGAKVLATARGLEKLEAAVAEIREATGGEIAAMSADISKSSTARQYLTRLWNSTEP